MAIVEKRGRLYRCQQAVNLFLLVGVLVVLLGWADLRWSSNSDSIFWIATPVEQWSAYTIGILIVAALAIRILAYWSFSRKPIPRVPDDNPPANLETIICCSGGGIKSASFCLGGLQALSQPPQSNADGAPPPAIVQQLSYQNAAAIVGVSGGGYIAAAFADRQFRNPNRPAFAPGSQEEVTLRQRTNYLVSSSRVRFDLVTSLLFGLLINLLIACAVLFIVVWLLIRQISLTGLIQLGPAPFWTFNPPATPGSDSDARPLLAIFWCPALLVTTAFIYFLCDRFIRPWKRPRSVRGWVARRFPNLGSSLSAWSTWFSNTPNTLVGLATIILLIYPGVPFFAVEFHNAWTDLVIHLPDIEDWFGKLQIGAVLTGVASFVTLVQVSLKGNGGKIWPWIGITIAALGTYLLLIKLTAWFVSQQQRSDWLLLWGIVFLALARLTVSANMTSMFPFYRGRLQFGFFHQPQRTGGTDARPPTLADLTAAHHAERGVPGHGGPQIVLCATANIKDGDLLPSGRYGTPFVLSDEIGFTDRNLPDQGLGRLPAGDYDPGGGFEQMDIVTAAAISGAAIAPLDGRENRRMGPYRVLLALANIRLGVWVRNPYWANRAKKDNSLVIRLSDFLDLTSPFQVIQEAFGMPSIYAPYLYLSDGGHYDNLGLVEALRRWPKRIIMLDGSGDAEDQFPAMGAAISTARMDLGVEVSFDPSPLMRGESRYPSTGWVRATARKGADDRQPQKRRRRWFSRSSPTPKIVRQAQRAASVNAHNVCEIYYVKCVLPANLSWDLESYQLENPSFPATLQRYEVFDEFDFEAYRRLGWSLIRDAQKQSWGEEADPPTSRRRSR